MLSIFKSKKEKEIIIPEQTHEQIFQDELARTLYYFLRGYCINSGLKGEVLGVDVVEKNGRGYKVDVYTSNQGDFIGVGGRNVTLLSSVLQVEFDLRLKINILQGVV